MELYLHIGTNKTGSSFLQTSLAVNKQALQDAGFFVADSQWDDKMLSGIITPGNGHQLARILAEKNPGKLDAYLQSLITQARSKGLDKIVLSNEILIRLFSSAEILAMLDTSLKKAGITKVKMLCIIRNLYGHALSLYKHRAKTGQWVDFEGWFAANYETMRIFKEFFLHYNNFAFEWMFELYEKDSNVLNTIFYSKFLGTAPLPLPKITKVNESLSLNSIRMVQLLENLYPGINTAALKALFENDTPRHENAFLVKTFYDAAEKYFSEHAGTINALKELVPDNPEKLVAMPQVNVAVSEEVLLSPTEYRLLAEIIKKHRSHSVKNFLKRKLLPLISAVNGKKRGNKFDNQKFGGSLR